MPSRLGRINDSLALSVTETEIDNKMRHLRDIPRSIGLGGDIPQSRMEGRHGVDPTDLLNDIW
jgi:hypothetical protein